MIISSGVSESSVRRRGGMGGGRASREFARRLHLRPLYRVRGVPNIFDGTDHVIKNILHIYILSSGVYYNILSTSGSYYKIELIFLKSAMFYSTGYRSLLCVYMLVCAICPSARRLRRSALAGPSGVHVYVNVATITFEIEIEFYI